MVSMVSRESTNFVKPDSSRWIARNAALTCGEIRNLIAAQSTIANCIAKHASCHEKCSQEEARRRHRPGLHWGLKGEHQFRDGVTGALTQIDIRGTGSVGLLHESGRRACARTWAWRWRGFRTCSPSQARVSPSVLSNMVVSIEQHVEWIGGCVAWLRKEGVEEIEATVEAEDAWVAHAGAFAACTLFGSTSSHYTGANVPGKPRQLLPYIGGVAAYRKKCDEVAAKGYEGFRLTKA